MRNTILFPYHKDNLTSEALLLLNPTRTNLPIGQIAQLITRTMRRGHRPCVFIGQAPAYRKQSQGCIRMVPRLCGRSVLHWDGLLPVPHQQMLVTKGSPTPESCAPWIISRAGKCWLQHSRRDVCRCYCQVNWDKKFNTSIAMYYYTKPFFAFISGQENR